MIGKSYFTSQLLAIRSSSFRLNPKKRGRAPRSLSSALGSFWGRAEASEGRRADLSPRRRSASGVPGGSVPA